MLRVLWTLLLVTTTAGSIVAQQADEQTRPFRIGVSAGLSRFIGDLGESNYLSAGVAVRTDIRFPASSIAFALTHWPDVSNFRMTAAHLEFAQDLSARRTVTPNLVLGLGHTWGSYRGTGLADEPTGASAAFGLGVQVVVSKVVIDADARLRTDGGGWNGEWRILGGLPSTAGLPRDGVQTSSVFIYRLGHVSGPWVTVSPGWGLRVAQPMVSGLEGVLTLSIVHWQIPNPIAPGAYSWDTRAVIAGAQGQWNPVRRLAVRLGPAVSAMGEGPDNGVNFGAIADLVLQLSVGPLRVEPAIGWLWLARSPSSSFDGSDQHGFLMSVGVGM